VIEDDDEMNSWIYGGKCTCKNVSTPMLKSAFERCDKKCVIKDIYI
jgi:hypothetical protein